MRTRQQPQLCSRLVDPNKVHKSDDNSRHRATPKIVIAHSCHKHGVLTKPDILQGRHALLAAVVQTAPCKPSNRRRPELGA